ncbi:MAG: DUF2802 domain-containing protein [Azoarcus sp.]|jgi:hypothetical protein|nr:DUF2802 domain-containing protein [Azoarcus sp.]
MRQLIWGVIAVLLIYGGWQFLSALGVDRLRRRMEPLAENRGAVTSMDEDLFGDAPAPAKQVLSSDEALPEPEGIVRNIAPANAFDPFALELELQRLRREVGGVREAFEIQRQEINALRAELERLAMRSQAPMAVTAEPDVSPEYDEALALARRGVMAGDIATRCGITRAEADLVASLAARARQREAEGGLA